MKTTSKDETNNRYGKLTVLEYAGSNKDGRTLWACICDCGNTTVVTGKALRRGHTKSCGCLQRDTVTTQNSTHKLSASPEYRAWWAMRQRCTNPSQSLYHRYGGRGITVDPRWDNFETFYADMGDKPSPAHTIERIDNDKAYGPDNCKWATRAEQARNYSRNVWLDTSLGRMLLKDAAAAFGIPASTLGARIRRGWPTERALIPAKENA
jgi:hypothetical protein